MQTFVSHVKRDESIAARHCDLLKYIFGFIKKIKRINRKQIINKKEECLDGPKGHLLPNYIVYLTRNRGVMHKKGLPNTLK
jgi:hypothetical protein